MINIRHIQGKDGIYIHAEDLAFAIDDSKQNLNLSKSAKTTLDSVTSMIRRLIRDGNA